MTEPSNHRIPANPLFVALRAFVICLQTEFSKDGSPIKWTDDPDRSEISISLDQPSSDFIRLGRPFITITRSTAVSAFKSLDQALEFSGGKISVVGELLSFTVFINVLAQKTVDSETIAILCRRLIYKNNRQLNRLGRIHTIDQGASYSVPSGANSVVQDGELSSWSLTTVAIGVSVQDNVGWSTKVDISNGLFPDIDNSVTIEII